MKFNIFRSVSTFKNWNRNTLYRTQVRHTGKLKKNMQRHDENLIQNHCWNGSKSVQNGSKNVSKSFKIELLGCFWQLPGPRLPQGARWSEISGEVKAKLTPRWVKLEPRWHQDAPSWSQDGAKLRNLVPRWTKDGQLGAEDGQLGCILGGISATFWDLGRETSHSKKHRKTNVFF